MRRTIASPRAILSTPVPVLERRRAACYAVRVTRAVLPIAAVLVLGLGVYLFVAVRTQPEPPRVVARAPRTPEPAEAAPPPPPPPAPTPAPAPPPRRVLPPSLGATPQGTIPTLAVTDGEPLVGAKLDAVMSEANKAYDRGDFDDAKTIAGRLLAKDPTNVRMLRIMVSASCQDGDSAVAQAHYAKLPPVDQAQMKTRCARFGVTFADKP